jgi:hypothetical protein
MPNFKIQNFSKCPKECLALFLNMSNLGKKTDCYPQFDRLKHGLKYLRWSMTHRFLPKTKATAVD